jgi:hypothetical protein
VELRPQQMSARALQMVDHARAIAGYEAPDSKLVGHAVVALWSCGGLSIGSRWYENSVWPRRLMHVAVGDAVELHMVQQPELHRALESLLGWEHTPPEDPDAA